MLELLQSSFHVIAIQYEMLHSGVPWHTNVTQTNVVETWSSCPCGPHVCFHWKGNFNE